ncbi:hypothetical protein ACJD0Z_11605 [Flavobacteriaceae bacterium M23B6Z8]
MKPIKKNLSFEKFVIAKLDNTKSIQGGSQCENSLEMETMTGIPDSDACFPPR